MAQRANKKGDGRRPRIGVSLPEEDFNWLRSLNPKNGVANSDSYLVARVVRAARLAGVTLDEATSGGVIPDLVEWLGKKRNNKLAGDLRRLLQEFLSR